MALENSARDPSLAGLVREVYRSTWNDFYIWEQDHCLRTLHSLARFLPQEPPQASPSPSTGLDPVSLPVSSLTIANSPSLDTENESFTIVDYGDGDSEPQTSTVPVKIVNITRPLEPCAPYEACTPANRNINVGDDSEYMPFIPLADDPTFNHARYAEDYRYFEWQLTSRDPDLEVILMQTVHILHYTHHILLQDIDKTRILPQPVYPNIINGSRRRDFPKWPSITTRLPYLPSHANASPSAKLSHLVNDFCHNANCVIGYCTVHLGDMPAPESIVPTIPTNALAYSVEAPCGAECFLLGKTPTIGTFWSDEDIETLNTVLAFSPDLSPCNLATICRKPCQEVFKHRGRIFPETNFAKTNDKITKGRPVRSATLQYQDHDAAAFTPNWPCSHSGPCDGRSNCPCVANNAHCERTCRCDRKCLRRWRGCTCAKSKQQMTCGTSRCPCYRAHRECDPEVCIKCEARDSSSDICKNACIQRGDRKRTQVRQSTWGLGLYIAEEAREEDFILEYTGELLYEVTSICRDFVSRHCGRSYLFLLNPTTSIDSTKAGNESRFINHDPINANCHACVRLVNGEHRIGLFALSRMPPGTELLLDYGDSFFQQDATEGEGDAGAAKPPPSSLDQVIYNLDQHSSDETYSE